MSALAPAALDATSRAAASLSLPAERGRLRLRIMTYNIRGRDIDSPGEYKKLAAFLRLYRPDIVSLQEVKRLGPVNQAVVLGRLSGYQAVYGEARGRVYGEGVAVLARRDGPLGLKIRRSRNHRLPKAKDAPKGDLQRCALEAEIEAKAGGRLRVVAAHLSHRDYEASRVAQARAILGLVQGPTLVLGDLNARPGSRPMRLLLSRLKDLYREASPGSIGNTYPSSGPIIRIDWLLASAGRGLAAWVVGRKGGAMGGLSDHAAVLAAVEVPFR